LNLPSHFFTSNTKKVFKAKFLKIKYDHTVFHTFIVCINGQENLPTIQVVTLSSLQRTGLCSFTFFTLFTLGTPVDVGGRNECSHCSRYFSEFVFPNRRVTTKPLERKKKKVITDTKAKYFYTLTYLYSNYFSEFMVYSLKI
jgi:hypothetical protein